MPCLNIRSWVTTCAPAVFFPTGMGMISRLFLRTGVQWTRTLLTSCDLFLTKCYFLCTKTLSHVRVRQYSVSFSVSLSCFLFLFFLCPCLALALLFSLCLCLVHSLFRSRTFSFPLSRSLSHTQTHKYTNTHVDTMRAYTSFVLHFLACSHRLVVSRDCRSR